MDCTKIDISKTQMHFDNLMTLLDSQILQPIQYKRKPWVNENKSSYIESLLMQLPQYPIIISHKYKDYYELIDGRERLAAIYEFVKNKLSLKGMEYLLDYEGMNYSQLPPHLQNRLLGVIFDIIYINAETPNNIRENLVKRIRNE